MKRCRCLWMVALALVMIPAATSQQPLRAHADKAAGPQPVMTLKVYDAQGNVLVNMKRNVLPRPKNNAFDVMRAIVTVDFDTFAGDPTASPPFTGGAFVNGIAGVAPPSGKYWFLYVDGTKSKTKGMCDITVTKDTLIEWKIEEYKANNK